MKKSINTTICCIAFAIVGICIAKYNNDNKFVGRPTISAAVPTVYDLPLDFQLNRKIMTVSTDTIRDTVYVDSSKVTKPKMVSAPRKVKTRKHTVLKDTVYVPLYFIIMPWVREEKAQDSTYCISDTLSKNVNHSVRDSLNSDSISHVLVRSHQPR